jgi:hypothetical protein
VTRARRVLPPAAIADPIRRLFITRAYLPTSRLSEFYLRPDLIYDLGPDTSVGVGFFADMTTFAIGWIVLILL